MATLKGQDFIHKYKGKGVNKDTWLIMYRKGHIELEELIDCIELTDEEIEEIRCIPVDASQNKTLEDKISILEQQVVDLEDSQLGQDFIIDDLIFEVIPMLEGQINMSNTQPVELASVLSNTLIKGESAMAAYLAKKIMDGRDYEAVFKTYSYKQYQDEVDTILELEGKGDLIKR